jgi:uncharacterized protein YggE
LKNLLLLKRSKHNEEKYTVSGAGSIAAAPDQVTIRIGVRTEGTEAIDTLEQNNQQMNNLLNALRQAGIPAQDIRTEGISISETDRFPIAARGVAEIADIAGVPVEPGLLSVQVQLEVT